MNTESPSNSLAVRERDRLLATVAHELRSPLMPIISSALVLQRRGIDQELVQATARIIERQGRLLARLIEDLLDAAHARLGPVQLQRRSTSMSEIVESCEQAMAPCIRDSGQFLQVTISPDSMEVFADATRLGQSLRNLIANAAKFSDRGATIRVHAARDRGDAVVAVSDDGMGIDASHLESIFTLYAQVGDRASGCEGGLGIGLYLARRFVEAHAGTLIAKSPGIGGGSTFTIRVPCVGFAPEASGFPQWGPSSRSVSALTTA